MTAYKLNPIQRASINADAASGIKVRDISERLLSETGIVYSEQQIHAVIKQDRAMTQHIANAVVWEKVSQTVVTDVAILEELKAGHLHDYRTAVSGAERRAASRACIDVIKVKGVFLGLGEGTAADDDGIRAELLGRVEKLLEMPESTFTDTTEQRDTIDAAGKH